MFGKSDGRTMAPGSPRSDWVSRASLTLLCLALYLPGIATIPPVDRDEARFAQATKQMLESGDFVRPRFQDDDRFRKPIGIYWLQSAAVVTTAQRGGRAIWPYRLPSLIGAMAAVLLTYRLGRRLFRPRVGLLAAALLASSVLLVVEAHLATTDASLLACVVASQACLAAIYVAGRGGRRAPARYAVGFWIAQGIAVVIKGPIAPAIAAMTSAVLVLLDGRSSARAWLSGLRPIWGLPLMAAIVTPWALAVGLATDGEFYRQWITGDLLPKVVGAHESHGGPPGLYLLLVIATFWPGSFALADGLTRAWRRRAHPGERFCLAWLIPTWVLFELMPTKLPHYVLPAYPALALLVAAALFSRTPAPASILYAGVVRANWVVWILLTFAGSAALAAGPAVLGAPTTAAGLITAILLGAVGITVMRVRAGGRAALAGGVAVIGAAVIFAPLLQVIVPALDPVWLSRAAADAVRRQAGVGGARLIAAVGYHEPSLVFLVGDDVELVDARRAAELLAASRWPPRPEGEDGEAAVSALALVGDEEREAFSAAARARGLHLRELWSNEGMNYSKGRRIRLRLFERAP